MSRVFFAGLLALFATAAARAEVSHDAPSILGGRTLRSALDPDPSAEVQAFCNDALGRTCRNAVTPADAEAFNGPVQAAATNDLFQALQSSQPDLTREELTRSLALQPGGGFDDWLERYIGYTQKLEDQLRRQGGGFDIRAMFEGEIKSAEIAAIQAHTSLSEDLRTKMIAAISRTRFYSPAEYLQSIQSNDQRQRFVKSYLGNCGPMGLSANAFSFQPGDGRPFPGVVVCPGAWTKGLAVREKTGTSLHDYFVFTLGHELGHNIDYQKFQGAYRYLVDCFRRNGVSTGQDPEQLPEITADYWASEAWSRLHVGLSGTALVRTAENTFADNCNTGGNEEHPPGDFRIQFMARNPRELERVGCSVPNRRNPSCAVEGQVPVGDDARVAQLEKKLKTTHPEGPNRAFFDAAEELLDRVPPQQAFAFARELPDNGRRAFQDLFNARYVIDPAFLQRIVYDSDSDPLLKEAARREVARGTNEPGVRFLYDSFGNRPERALVFDRRLRHALQRGDERNLARVLAFLVASIGRDRKLRVYGEVQQQLEMLERSKGDPNRINMLHHLIWALRDALKVGPPPETSQERRFRELFAPAYAKMRGEGNATWERVDRAVGGDEPTRRQLLHDLDPESSVDLMASLLGSPYENLAVKLLRVFASRAEDGTLSLQLSMRHLGERGTRTLVLGKTDEELRDRLHEFNLRNDLRRYTISEAELMAP